MARIRPAGLFAPRWLLSTGPGWWQMPDSGAGDRPTVPGPAGARNPAPALVAVVVDESPSEREADPHGHRHVAGRRVVELLRGDLAHPGDRVAVVHFTDEVSPLLRPVSPHSRRGARALRRHLRPAGRGDGTDIGAALARSAHLCPVRWPGPVVVVLLTDGVDETPADELVAAVGLFPRRAVHAVSIGGPLPDLWGQVPLGSATVVPVLRRPDEVEWVVARVLYEALGVGWVGPHHPPGG